MLGMSDQQLHLGNQLRTTSEVRHDALRGLTRLIAQALGQADAIGCEHVAMYLAAARDIAEAAAERHGFTGRTN